MGYTTFRQNPAAVEAAARLAHRRNGAGAADADERGARALHALAPLLIDEACAEAGVWAPDAATLALVQARGDAARAVSLLRAWAATLPRHGTFTLALDDIAVERRITPALADAPGGQYLGGALDYAQRLLRFSEADDGGADESADQHDAGQAPPARFPRAVSQLEAEGLVAYGPPAEPVDPAQGTADGRGRLLSALSRGDTGALTSMAYTVIRGHGPRQDPTLAELRVGEAPVRVAHPRDGQPFTVGRVPITVAEAVLYRLHDEAADARLTLGAGATLGRLERRAIAAAILDASCARAAGDPPDSRPPGEDPEFLTLALDGQEAAGFVEHLKLPHHVTFTSELERLRAGDDATTSPMREDDE